MKKGRDSVRFVDPSWNEISPGDRLWPTFFYTLGLTEKTPPTIAVSDSAAGKSNSDDREIKDKIFNL